MSEITDQQRFDDVVDVLTKLREDESVNINTYTVSGQHPVSTSVEITLNVKHTDE